MIIGHNIFTKYGFVSTVDYAHKTGANVYQIFLRSPQSLKGKRRNSKELLEIKKKATKYNIKILVHGSYMLNFCNPKNSYIYKEAVKILSEDLNDAHTMGAIGVVIHMGHNVERLNITNEQAKKNYIAGIEEALKKSHTSSILILETGAGQGNEICTSIDELGQLRECIDKNYRHRVKFCIDTCHIYASGYDVGNINYISMLVLHIENTLKWENVYAIHLNDSKDHLNSRKDRHADIGKGKINLHGLIEFSSICAYYNIPIVLEVPCETYDNKKYHYTEQIQLIRDMYDTFKIISPWVN